MEDLVTFLATMPFWYWWILAVGLLIIEIMTGTTYVLWPAASAAVVGFLDMTVLNGQWQLQLVIFAVLTFILTMFVTPYVSRYVNNEKTDKENLNKRGSQKIGKRATVSTAFANGQGKVQLGDTVWLAEAEGGVDIAEGTTVEVIDAQGTKVVVKPV
jgi:hypothetical protein